MTVTIVSKVALRDAPLVADEGGDDASPSGGVGELVVIDWGIADIDAVRQAALARGAEVAMLEPGRDGLEHIAALLAGRRGMAALHVVGHGRAGAIQLAGTEIDGATAGRRSGTLARIGAALAPGGNLLLYGCDVASTHAGRAFVARLATLTGASVAAATGPIGAEALGGNWALAHRVGRLAVAPLQVPAMRGTLAVFTVTNLNDSGDGSLRQAIADAGIGGTNTIVFQDLSGTLTLDSGISVPERTFFTFGGATTALTIDGAAITVARAFIQLGDGRTLTINSEIEEETSGYLAALALRSGNIIIGNEATDIKLEAQGARFGFIPGYTSEDYILVNDEGEIVVPDGNLTIGGFYGGSLFELDTPKLTKTGPGTLYLTKGANLYDGYYYINEGFISISNANMENIAYYTVGINGGGLEITGETTLVRPMSIGANGGTISTTADTVLSGGLSGSGSLTKTGPATLILTGANNYAGTTTVSTGTLGVSNDGNLGAGAVILDGGALLVRVGANIDNDVKVGTSGGTISLAADATFTGAISGTGTLTKTGSGTLTLSGTNTYTGTTTITEGTLRLSGGSAIADNATVNVANGATLDLNGTTETIGALTGSGTVTVGAGTLTLSDPAAGSFSGMLTGTSTYSIASGATLKGTGTYSMPVEVMSGATIAPGNSPGTISTGSLTLASGATARMEIDGTTAGTDYDQIAVTGTVTINGADLTPVFGYTSSTGDRYVLIDNDGTDAVTGTFSGLAEGAAVTSGGRLYQISYAGNDGNDVTLTDFGAAASSGDGSGGGSSEMFGSAGADALVGGDGDDTVSALAGSDEVWARNGADLLYGNQGGDTLWGQAGTDALYGGQGADLLYGNQAGDRMWGNLDADTLYGGQGDDLLYGNEAGDLLRGNDGNDRLYGGQEADTLSGDGGDDGLWGCLGADRFVFADGSGADAIFDFSRAEGDVIAVAAGVNGTGIGEAGDLLARLASDSAGDAVLDLGAGNSVTLVGVAAGGASADWFLVA